MLRTLTASLLLAFPLSAQTFTVGPGGDFAQVADALASPLVVPGSKVFVASGTYASFEVTKAISLFGTSAYAPEISIHDVPQFQLTGFGMGSLIVRNVSTKGLIENCAVYGGTGGITPYGTEGVIENVQSLFVGRTSFKGTSTCYPDVSNSPSSGLAVLQSRVTFVDCDMVGGNDNLFFPPYECTDHYPLSTVGLAVRGNSNVDLIASTLTGFATTQFAFTTAPGLLVESSTVNVRGRSNGPSSDLILGMGTDAIQADAQSTVFYSGLTLVPQTLPPFTVQVPLAEAFLRVEGTFGLGDQANVQLYAPAGQPMWTSFSVVPQGPPLPFVGNDLWLDAGALGGIFPSSGQGINNWVSLPVTVPVQPTLVGKTLGVQALTWVNGGLELINPYLVVVGV